MSPSDSLVCGLNNGNVPDGKNVLVEFHQLGETLQGGRGREEEGERRSVSKVSKREEERFKGGLSKRELLY